MKQLDEALPLAEANALDGHLAECLACARERDLHHRIAGALRAVGQEEVMAPPELGGRVFAAIRAERRGILHRLSPAWRQVVAAAATVFLLVSGAGGVNMALKLAADNNNTIGYVTPAPDGTGSDIGSPDGQPVSELPGVNGGTDGADQKSPDTTQPDNGDRTAPDPVKPDQGITEQQTKDGQKTTVAVAPGPEPQVLLNGGLRINSTILKVSVPDLNNARTQALALATKAGAKSQVFPEQATDRQIQVMRLTVDEAQASGLLSDLSGLGTVIDKDTESQDMTATYNETLAQYRALQTEIETADSEKAAQLVTQAAGLKQQLNSWADEAEKWVIILWLEIN